MEIVDRLEESLPSRFEPEVLLPSQYYELMKRNHQLDGERRLMLAVLEDAIHCYLKNMNAKTRRQRILFYEAQNWMNAKNKIGLFAFDTLCQALNVDPSRLRKALESARIRARAAAEKVTVEPRMPAKITRPAASPNDGHQVVRPAAVEQGAPIAAAPALAPERAAS